MSKKQQEIELTNVKRAKRNWELYYRPHIHDLVRNKRAGHRIAFIISVMSADHAYRAIKSIRETQDSDIEKSVFWALDKYINSQDRHPTWKKYAEHIMYGGHLIDIYNRLRHQWELPSHLKLVHGINEEWCFRFTADAEVTGAPNGEVTRVATGEATACFNAYKICAYIAEGIDYAYKENIRGREIGLRKNNQ